MVGRCLDETEHVIDSYTGKGTQKRKDHLGKYQTTGMYPKVVVCACNKNFAQHLLSSPPATNGAKRNLGKLRSPTAENRNKALTLHGYMESSNYSPSPLVSQAVTTRIAGSGL